MAQRFRDRFHEPISGFTHLGGAVLSALGMIWLIVLTWDAPARMISVIIYSISTILTYSASTSLHLPKVSEKARLWLARIDHASIYVMIAGTYTPLIYNVMTNDGWRWGSLWFIWGLAAVGVIYKLFMYQHNSYLSTILYVAMGWVALFLLPQILPTMPPAAMWLCVIGGVVYSAGAVIFAVGKPNFHRYFGFHELWHVFVLGGSVLHFAAVMVVLQSSGLPTP